MNINDWFYSNQSNELYLGMNHIFRNKYGSPCPNAQVSKSEKKTSTLCLSHNSFTSPPESL